MSHRYRVAFKQTLCGSKKPSYYSANGFVRDQSSFRETTVHSSYDTVSVCTFFYLTFIIVVELIVFHVFIELLDVILIFMLLQYGSILKSVMLNMNKKKSERHCMLAS